MTDTPTAFSCVDTKSVFDPVKTVSNCIKPYHKRPTERLSAEKNRKPPKVSRPPQRLPNSLIHNANACISAKKGRPLGLPFLSREWDSNPRPFRYE